MNICYWVAMVAMCALAACAQDAGHSPAVPPPPEVGQPLPNPGSPPLRVIVQFSPSTPMQEEALLQSLQAQTQAKVRFITAVSEDTHVYLFQPASGQTQAQLLQRLGAMPSVLRAEIDLKAKPH